MSEFNYKDYIANNPLLKEGKEIEFPEGLRNYLFIHKLILNDTPKDIFNKMTSSERNALEKMIKQWEETTKELNNAVLDYAKTKFKNRLENLETTLKKNIEIYYKRINYDPKEEARKKDEKNKKAKAERDRKSSISYDLKKMRDQEAEDALSEALEFMGTADEDTMKYLNSLGKDELVALEKQFVDMFATLTDIRYDGSEQLSKGASEISQRIHNFITIIRQVLKGNPVVKEETIDEALLDTKELDEMYEMRDALKKVIQFTQSLKFYGTDEESKQAEKVYGSNGLQKLVRLLTQRIAKIEGQ